MAKKAILICSLLLIVGCDKKENVYPERPKDTPYFYNKSSITDADQDICVELRRARELTGIEFVMVLLKDIPRGFHTIEYAAELFHKWEIGSKTNGKGVLILFVENTHTLKIEVGYELEGIFTDAFCSSFQPTIKNYYAGQYFGDVFTGILMYMERKVIDGIDIDIDTFFQELIPASKLLNIPDSFLSGGGGIIDNEYFYDKKSKFSKIRLIPEEKIKQFNSDKDISVVIARYFRSLKEGINYPFLNIFTEGSQMMRLEYPESINFLQLYWRKYQEQSPYQIVYNKTEDLAAVRFKGLLWPLFLRKCPDGFWKMDVTKAWAFSQANYSLTELYPLYKDHPWMFAFPEYKYQKSLCNVPRLQPDSFSVKDEIIKLEGLIKNKPDNASNYFKLADVLYWECYWIGAAIDVVEKGLELEPDNVPYRWLAIFMRYRYPKIEYIPKHFDTLLEINPNNVVVLKNYISHCRLFTKENTKATELERRLKKVERSLLKKTMEN